ncbi:unannotated protein [freshwater metagenome]|uniref:Unannotated protein n=1 Tax=freshwater metagenome TaxID=449393 RepID=A0A6J6ARE7_9ZZZZ
MTGMQCSDSVVDRDFALLEKPGEPTNKTVDDSLLAHLGHREIKHWL